MRVWLFPVAVFLAGCGGREMLEVRSFQLRETEVGDIDPLIRGEMQKRLYGAVTLAEREARLGQYYTARWSELTGRERVRVVFEFRQAVSGAAVRRMEKTFAPAAEGATEFRVIGEDFKKGGRVLSWQVSLYEGGELRASKRSYLWN